MTIPACLAFCSAQSLALAGLEYGRECYCASALGPNTLLNATGCTMACAGDNTQVCGGRSRLSVYNNTALSAPAAKQTIGQFAYQGCYTDPSAAQRALQGYSTSSSSMTQDLCVQTCSAKGYTLAGVEYGRECYCANSLATVQVGGKAVQAAEGDCGMLCAGDRDELCGGSSRIGVWMVT
ncbi:hypothetical protein A1O3_03989 [Capronia epimyces CBS 606.96]|uniref:WSC domain-containing protein n=1 Tax=Capronia epimyces CBS 606.96 TaxID=1182542 RepID=W9Y2J7_9EURO|nr:uncharacterized protein A1O3_03989 [Capronia epimyces CBS 606.96]EXJ87032.1 hypothetical protein A1O3_03989 [Capronia epimyces CBS 606.96]